jgi:hypothetical protein
MLHLKWSADQEYAVGEAKVSWNCDVRERLSENLLYFLLAR